MSVIDKLNNIINCKNAIRTSINNKGGTLTESSKFSDYAAAINNLTVGGGSGSNSVNIVKPIYAEQKDPIPNTGHLEKIFFNTKLTTDQVDALIANANLTFISDGGMNVYPILMTNTGMIITIFDYSSELGVESGSAWLIGDLNSDTTYYVSPTLAAVISAPAGWTESSFTSFDTGEVTIGAELVQEMQGVAIGSQNNLLTDLVRLYSLVDTGKVETLKTLSGQYKIAEQNITLDTKDNMTYTYDFVNSINENTKEINVIKKIEVSPAQEDAIISRDIATYTNDRALGVGYHAFHQCRKLTSVNFPKAIVITDYAFYYCDALSTIDFPLVKRIDQYAFSECRLLETVTFPKAEMIDKGTFYNDVCLIEANLPKLNAIGTQAFYSCCDLVKVFISQKDSVCRLTNTNAFDYCYHILGTTNSTYNPNGLKDGYIYVPASLLAQYKVAKNWTTYATQIIGHEDLEAGASLPNYTTSSFTTQTWYSDEKLTTVVTSVAASGTYYCRLAA